LKAKISKAESHKDQETLWKLLKVTNEFSPIDYDLILEIAKSLEIAPPQPEKVPSLLESYYKKIILNSDVF
jgi:hypothetical protein